MALSPGERTLHYAGGIGLTFNSRIELNAGADFANYSATISTSLVPKLSQ